MASEAKERVLGVERDFYEEHFEEFRLKYPGRHLLICGAKLCGDFATREEAVLAGYRLDAEEMLIRRSGTREKKRSSLLPMILLDA